VQLPGKHFGFGRRAGEKIRRSRSAQRAGRNRFGLSGEHFWKKNDAIYTPNLEAGCLKGTTRDFILENFAVEERASNLSELCEADEIFLTSAGIGIVAANLKR
jgi:hypothetical protein